MKRLIAVLLWLTASVPAWAAGPVHLVFGTDWLAEAEHGGFYEALALGLYKAHGLDIEIKMGGPQTNGSSAVANGQVDFQLSSGSFAALALAEQKIPVVAVAAFFQKDPQVLMSHPGEGIDTMEQMRGHPMLLSPGAHVQLWEYLKRRFGFVDTQYRPYNFALAPFILDKKSVLLGFISSEPYLIEKEGGFKPVVNLLGDNGFANYSDVILVQAKMVREHPELVQAFVDATAEGWYHYMYGDPAPGNALIRRANPDMAQDVLDNAIKVMREHGIVDSGDSLTRGIGAMSAERWAEFLRTMTEAGVYHPGIDPAKAYTLQFVNKRVGMELRPK